ncbi:MAG: CCA tRNA nucleotidyltransferase [Planctomycetota bacterium]|nr:CCA tRNA nucleotidyltransferase [Planctomycetota bacterium]
MNPLLKPPCDPQDALEVLKRLRGAGHIAYFAGGCVRDKLLGQTPKDWDVATDAPPPRVRELFSKTEAVGAAFGVILVRHRQSVIEVATFRTDLDYEDGRRPTAIRFTTAEEDAQRRDFTINGLFFDPIENRVIDYVGGREDLQNHRLRAIGDPSQRFEEDQLRLLRAVRFAARFELTIDPPTARAIKKIAPRLKGISPERIGDELRLMLSPPARSAAWRLLWEFDLAPVIFRFLPKLPPSGLNMEQSIFLRLVPDETISIGLALAAATLCVQRQADPSVDVTTLLKKPAISQAVRAMRQALKISNAESDEMALTLSGLEPMLAVDPPALAMKMRFLAEPTSPLSRRLMKALADLHLHDARISALAAEFETLQHAKLAPAPLLNGDELTAAGYEPGPIFKRILATVYDAQLESRISTKTQALEMAAKLVTQSPRS